MELIIVVIIGALILRGMAKAEAKEDEQRIAAERIERKCTMILIEKGYRKA